MFELTPQEVVIDHVKEARKVRSKTHQRLTERFLIGRNRTKPADFREVSLAAFRAVCTCLSLTAESTLRKQDISLQVMCSDAKIGNEKKVTFS